MTHHRALSQIFDRHAFSFLVAPLRVRTIPAKTIVENTKTLANRRRETPAQELGQDLSRLSPQHVIRVRCERRLAGVDLRDDRAVLERLMRQRGGRIDEAGGPDGE